MATQVCFVGNTYDQEITVVDEDGAVVDITDGTLKITIVDNLDAVMATNSETSFSDPTNGVGKVGFTAAETAVFTIGVFNYAINFTNSTGKNWDVLTGMFQVTETATT